MLYQHNDIHINSIILIYDISVFVSSSGKEAADATVSSAGYLVEL